MNLSEAEKRMIYQVEGTSQGAALNEIYMTWRYAPDKAMTVSYTHLDVYKRQASQLFSFLV